VCLRDFYCDEKLSRALDRYAPEPYPGSFVIFRQPNNGTEAGWRALALGQVDFQDTWVDHNELLEEPYVQILAGSLRSYLDQAQIGQTTRNKDSAAQNATPANARQLISRELTGRRQVNDYKVRG
jgi:hypothetical protein